MYAPGRYTRVTVTPGKSYVCGCDVQRYHTLDGEYVNKLTCSTHNQPVAVAPSHEAEPAHSNSMYCKCGVMLGNHVHTKPAADNCAWPDKHPKPCDCRARAASAEVKTLKLSGDMIEINLDDELAKRDRLLFNPRS